jgi:flagellar hook protein FlgE
MYSGVSGLINMQTAMDVIGNNIANVNTTGFKSSSVNFADILSQTIQGASSPQGTTGGTNPEQVGLGMSVASVSTNFTDGNFESTGNPDDMALSGSGFFVLQNGNSQVYTRAGSFTQDSAGNFVSPDGYKLMGWVADASGNVNTGGALQAITIPTGTAMASQASTEITMTKNLNGDAAVGYSYTGTSAITDSLGTQHTVDTTYYKVAVNPTTQSSTWLTYSSVSDPTVSGSVANQWQEVTFDANGALQQVQSIPDSTAALSKATDTLSLTGLNLDPTASSTSTQDFSAIANGKPENFALAFTANSSATNTWNYTLSQVGGTATTSGVVKYTGTVPTGAYTFYESDGTTPAPTLTAGDLTVTTGSPLTSTTAPTAGVFSVSPAETANTAAATAAGTSAVAFTAQFTNGSSAVSITRNLSQLTQYGGLGASTILETSDGYPAGTLTSSALGSGGVITGSYSNGQKRTLAEVALANFTNPGGLTEDGSNNYVVSNNSGNPQIGAANTGGLGTITGSGLEMSNVDLAQEFSNMIITERGYQANSKIITTSDEMLQTLNSLKQ